MPTFIPVDYDPFENMELPYTYNHQIGALGERRRLENATRTFMPDSPLSANVEDRRSGFTPHEQEGNSYERIETPESASLAEQVGAIDIAALADSIFKEGALAELKRRFQNYGFLDQEGHFPSAGHWQRDVPSDPDVYYRSVGLLPPLPETELQHIPLEIPTVGTGMPDAVLGSLTSLEGATSEPPR